MRPLSGAGGAEIGGVDLARPLDDETIAELRRAFADHLVIGFRDQRLDPEQLSAFARHWGTLTRHPFIKTLRDHPDVAALMREAEDSNANFGGLWHADTTMLAQPPVATLLYAVDVPPFGGDTLFANLFLAYEALSPGMQRMTERLGVMHSVARNYDPFRGPLDPAKVEPVATADLLRILDEIRRETRHPLVRVHPDSGRKALWMVGDYCLRFEDMSEAESRPLLDFLLRHVTSPHFGFRWSWAPGAVLLWDNRFTIHCAVNDYRGHRREMLRIQIGAETPIGADTGG